MSLKKTTLLATPPGFIDLDDPITASEAANNDPTRILMLAKSAVQLYLSECLSGQFKDLFARFTKYSVEWSAQDFSEDESERKVQVARYFKDLKEKLPQIFIQDGGFTYNRQGLGPWDDAGRLEDGTRWVRQFKSYPMPITLTIATLDEQMTEDLATFVSEAFGDLLPFTVADALKIGNSSWRLIIPLTFTIDAKTNTPFHEDHKEQVWFVTITSEFRFESYRYMNYRVNTTAFYDPTAAMLFTIPSKIRLGQTAVFSVNMRREGIEISSSDSKVGLIDPERQTLLGKRLGSFKFLVRDRLAGGSLPKILQETLITVVP